MGVTEFPAKKSNIRKNPKVTLAEILALRKTKITG